MVCKKTFFVLSAVGLATAVQALTVSDVVARQRWPWNNVVDVDFTVNEAAPGAKYKVDLKAVYAGGDRMLTARTFVTEPIAKAGANRVTWDLGNDYPNFKAKNVQMAVTVTEFDNVNTPIYMKIDLSGGKDAASYPVRYSVEAPVHSPKANDTCKTTELWLRRISPVGKTIKFDNSVDFCATLTKDYYIAIFETTQQQWYQIAGTWPSYMSNEVWRATRPVDAYYPVLLFGSGTGNWKWPDSQEIKETCCLQKLRDRTQLATLNLPTDAQWQFAAAAGSPSKVYQDSEGKDYAIAEIARYKGNSGTVNNGMLDADNGSACVGSYAPNAFGLYDMLGNVTEDCLDPYAAVSNIKAYYDGLGMQYPIEDYAGLPQGKATEYFGKLRTVMRGAAYKSASGDVTLFRRNAGYTGYADDTNGGKDLPVRGFRFCVTCE